MSDDKVTLTMAERIKIGRTEKKWTQKQLAQAAKVPQANISRYERGVANPDAGTLNRIFDAIGRTHTLDAVDGVLGIQGRAAGKLNVIDPMAPPVPVEWLVEGFVARGFLTMLAGQAGAGKSMVTQTLAAAIVEGRENVAGFKLAPRTVEAECADPETCEFVKAEGDRQHWHTRNDTRALVIDAENGENLIQDRAQNQGLTKEDAPRYIVAASDGFDIYKDRATLDGALADYRDKGEPVDLLVLDSFTSLWFGNENVVEQVMAVLKYLNELAKRYSLGILLIHHTDKEGDSYRGSSAIAATIGGGVFAFSRYDERDGEDITARQLVCQKMRIAAEPERRKLYVTGHGISDQPATSEQNIAHAVAELRRAAETYVTVPSAVTVTGSVNIRDFPEDEWTSEDGKKTWTRQEFLDKLAWEAREYGS